MSNSLNKNAVYSKENYVSKLSAFVSAMLLMNAIAFWCVPVIQDTYFGGVNELSVIGILAMAFFGVSIVINLIIMHLIRI